MVGNFLIDILSLKTTTFVFSFSFSKRTIHQKVNLFSK